MVNSSPRVTDREIIEVIKNHLTARGVSEERIVSDATWKKDLGIDSLDILTLTQELEDTFKVKIGEEEAIDIRNVGDAVDFILEASSGQLAEEEDGNG